jgi:hypothetical protein
MAGWDDGRGKWEVVDEHALDANEGGAGEAKERRVKKWESCKPWRGARCILYHEHEETESCGDVFLGR